MATERVLLGFFALGWVCCALLQNALPAATAFKLGNGEPVPTVQRVRSNVAADAGPVDEELSGKVPFVVLSREPELATLVGSFTAMNAVWNDEKWNAVW